MSDTPPTALTPDPAPPDPNDAQQQLAAAGHDLERLQALLAGACGDLAERFHEVVDLVEALEQSAGSQDAALRGIATEARRLVSGAVMALQFEDMATQLIGHTQERLRHCQELLAGVGTAPAAGAPRHASPVPQSEMQPGSIELF